MQKFFLFSFVTLWVIFSCAREKDAESVVIIDPRYSQIVVLQLNDFNIENKNLLSQPEMLPAYFYALTSYIQKFFGGWSIDKELFDFIANILPGGKTVLELGSGWSTGQFSKNYTVYSVEHSKEWLGKYPSNYIYAPIKDGWYDTQVLVKELPKDYDLILVDGPPGSIGRGKFYDNLHLFNTNVPIIFDDVDRRAEYALMKKVAQKLGRNFEVFSTSSTKQFGVIMPI